jgi:hypothetical protein
MCQWKWCTFPRYNPYRANTMLNYNRVDGRLYFYDDRRLLSVNVRTRAASVVDDG